MGLLWPTSSAHLHGKTSSKYLCLWKAAVRHQCVVFQASPCSPQSCFILSHTQCIYVAIQSSAIFNACIHIHRNLLTGLQSVTPWIKISLQEIICILQVLRLFACNFLIVTPPVLNFWVADSCFPKVIYFGSISAVFFIRIHTLVGKCCQVCWTGERYKPCCAKSLLSLGSFSVGVQGGVLNRKKNCTQEETDQYVLYQSDKWADEFNLHGHKESGMPV